MSRAMYSTLLVVGGKVQIAGHGSFITIIVIIFFFLSARLSSNRSASGDEAPSAILEPVTEIDQVRKLSLHGVGSHGSLLQTSGMMSALDDSSVDNSARASAARLPPQLFSR